MKWYVACRTQGGAAPVRDALIAAGEQVVSRWIDVPASQFGEANQTYDQRSAGARECLLDCCEADAVVIVTDGGRAKGGKHFECGVVYGRTGKMHVIGPRENIFHWLDNVHVHATIAEFLLYITKR